MKGIILILAVLQDKALKRPYQNHIGIKKTRSLVDMHAHKAIPEPYRNKEDKVNGLTCMPT